MRANRSSVVFLILISIVSCTPLPPSGEGTSGGRISTACTFPQNASTSDLRMNCTITGAPENVLVDPANASNHLCAPTSFSLFSQTLTAPETTLIWGESGDDGAARVRIGVVVANSTHTGKLAKSFGLSCESTIQPVADLTTNFSGRHVALIDKGKTPMCVFESRYTGENFAVTATESLSGVGGDVSVVTRGAVENAIARQLDLEAASAVNRLLGMGNRLDAAFRRRAGRCPNDYTTFQGS